MSISWRSFKCEVVKSVLFLIFGCITVFVRRGIFIWNVHVFYKSYKYPTTCLLVKYNDFYINSYWKGIKNIYLSKFQYEKLILRDFRKISYFSKKKSNLSPFIIKETSLRTRGITSYRPHTYIWRGVCIYIYLPLPTLTIGIPSDPDQANTAIRQHKQINSTNNICCMKSSMHMTVLHWISQTLHGEIFRILRKREIVCIRDCTASYRMLIFFTLFYNKKYEILLVFYMIMISK